MLSLGHDLNLDLFNPDYTRARRSFVEYLQVLPKGLIQKHDSYLHPLKGPRSEPLFCDFVCLAHDTAPTRLVILISATHGVEGFAGSAIQCDVLRQIQALLRQHQDLGVLMIHGLNPWGMAWLRRCDHMGIDVNRNFVDFDRLPAFAQAYEDLQGWITQGGDAQSHWQHLKGNIDSACSGQYRYDNGIFYGGRESSWSRRTLEAIAEYAPLQSARTCVVVDLHTGLGPYAYGEVINDHPPDTSGFQWARQCFGANAQSSILGESVSGEKTGLLDYFWHARINSGCFVTLEFGTYSLRELFTCLVQEQAYHNSVMEAGQPRDITHPSVGRIKDYFYPEEISWRQQVLFRARQVFNMAVKGGLG